MTGNGAWPTRTSGFGVDGLPRKPGHRKAANNEDVPSGNSFVSSFVFCVRVSVELLVVVCSVRDVRFALCPELFPRALLLCL